VIMLAHDVKQEALRLRRAIEEISVEVWTVASGLPRDEVTTKVVSRRLILMVTMVDDPLRLEVFRAVRQAARVYSETSDVLHGRTRGSRFRGVQVEEWEADLLRLEALWAPLKQDFSGAAREI